MEKQITRKTIFTTFWFVFITPFILMLLIVSNYNSTFNNLSGSFIVKTFQNSYSNLNQIISFQSLDCSGKYIYMHELPSRFNYDLLENCHSLLVWSDMCSSVSNNGFGPMFDTEETNDMSNYASGSWFQTNQFMLGVIFHNRMKNYKCLTNNSLLASAFYVPFYSGLEVGRNLWGVNRTTRDSLSLELVKILREKTEWKKMMGRDHFLISGRIAWDFRRVGDNESDWGNKLMFLPVAKNMTMLAIEATMWKNDAAIPYPTHFHPKTEKEVFSWQNVVRNDKRKYLFSFAGAPRPTIKESIRSEIIRQCQESSSLGGLCSLLSCISTSKKNCENPVHVINLFRSSVFCLQPAGDSYTRRSFFDSILAGCIPVLFHERSAYRQYLWHLPKNHTKYSVLIPENDVRNGKVKIRDVLQRFSKDEVVEMRNEVIKLIPRVIYSNGGFDTIEDAFDIALNGMLERVESTRKDILEGRNSKLEFGTKDDWK